MVGALLLFGMSHIGIAAQEATPSPTELTCTIPPREAAFFETIQGTPVVPDANRAPLIDAYRSSDQPATAEQVAELQETMDQFIACYNAGDYARLFALFSDGYWQREVGDLPARAGEFVRMIQTTSQTTSVRISDEKREGPTIVVDARTLPDGRLAALVHYDVDQAPDDGIDLIVFTKIGDLWLIDEVVTDVGSDLATPQLGQ
jgi:hypothetical protein